MFSFSRTYFILKKKKKNSNNFNNNNKAYPYVNTYDNSYI